jgi:SAM-dependent methyltransferase
MSLAKSALNTVHGNLVFRRRVRVLASHIAPRLPPGGRVLDVGAGDGSIAAAIAWERPDVAIEGIDVSLRPVAHIPVSQFDGTHIPFADDTFDAIILVDVLHHTDDPAVLLREAARVSKGLVLVKDHLRDQHFSGATLRIMDWVGNRGHDVVLPYNYLSSSAWARVFEAAGLSVEGKEERLGIYPMPFTWLFDREMQVIFTLRKVR